MSYFSKRALRWAAPVALVGALGLAACGDSAAPNNRAAVQGQADAYVEQQQDRASENTDSENAPILPHYSENSRASENTDSENAPILPHYSENSRP
jgi:hypothetical protein